MTHVAPELSNSDIQLELDRIFSRERRAFVAALYGRGGPGHVTAAGRELLSILDALAAEEATASALCPIVSEATITSIMLARDHGRHQDI